MIHLCEIKFAGRKLTIDKKYAIELERKEKVFRQQTKTPKAVFLTMITTYGVKQNNYSRQLIQGEVTMDDLFQPG